MEKKVVKIIKPDLSHLKRKRVAVYCRVSTEHIPQLESLDAQIDFYTKYVNDNPRWILVDIYADSKSGKNSNRPEFQRMLRDCSEGKIDLILTKAVSRFGRNTVDVLEALRKLYEYKVEVFFKTDNLHVTNPDNELIITFISAYAQAESEARSQNIKMGIKNRIIAGTSKLYDRPCYGYRHDKNGELEVVWQQALVVQKIYDYYLDGASVVQIIKLLYNEGIKSPTGKEKWSKKTIENILSNEKYIGNVILYKTFSKDYPNNKRIINKDNEHRQYLSTNNHPPIIDEEIFLKVQEERSRRSNIEITPEGKKRKSAKYSSKKPNINIEEKSDVE